MNMFLCTKVHLASNYAEGADAGWLITRHVPNVGSLACGFLAFSSAM